METEVKGEVQVQKPKKELRYDLYQKDVIDQLIEDIDNKKVTEGEQYILALEILNIIMTRAETSHDLIRAIRETKEMPEMYIVFYRDLLTAFGMGSEEEASSIYLNIGYKLSLMEANDTKWKYVTPDFMSQDYSNVYLIHQYDAIIKAIGCKGVFQWVYAINWKYLINER